MTFVIYGPPRTKKTSQRIIGSGPKCGACGKRTGRPFLLPSEENVAWAKVAVAQLRTQLAGRAPLEIPVNCRALIFRDANRGDAVGYYQAIADALEEAGVLTNDRFVVSWDGSRALKDAANPRIEILLAPVVDAEHSVTRAWRPRATRDVAVVVRPGAMDHALTISPDRIQPCQCGWCS